VISWGIARSIAVALAERRQAGTPAGGALQVGFDYPEVVAESLGPLEGFTGIGLPDDGARRVRVASRSEWIDLNISSFGALLEPLLKKAASTAGDLTYAVSAAALTAQIGLLLGFLSSRVLGQYDTGPLVAREQAKRRPGEPGEIFFLDGNIVSAAGRLGVPVDALRRYIVLHETTHALQFEGHPWLRDHLGGLMESFTGSLADKVGPREATRRLAENLRRGGRSFDLVMSAEQREALDKMQATMSVIEGHADLVMHHVGRALVPGFEGLKARMDRSRLNRPPLETAIFRITGLDMKLEQYRMGEAFASAVLKRQGMDGLNRVWEGPESMPTLEEIRDPGLWMARMGGTA
jgi:coenzyme F420 biosynthesis associated uncharacterized protein